jgi:hypothetical protein
MNVDSWTGRWHIVEEQTYHKNPQHVFHALETRVRANGLSLWMESDLRFPDGTMATWQYDGAMDGVMRPITFVHNGALLTNIAFYLLGDNYGGDSNRRPDGKQIGCETWRLDQDILSVWGVHHVEDLGEFPYREIWRRVP